MSAMVFVGPRVYAAMADDGVLPRALAPRPDGHPPPASVVLQGLIALVILLTHTLQQVLANVGAVLTLFAALTALGVFRAPGRGRALRCVRGGDAGGGLRALALAGDVDRGGVGAGRHLLSDAPPGWTGAGRRPLVKRLALRGRRT